MFTTLTIVVMLVIGALVVGLVSLAGAALHVGWWVVTLPFRALFWLIALPFLLVKVALLIVGAAALAVGLVVSGAALTLGVLAAVLVPLAPIALLVFAVWAIARLLRRPATT